MPRSDALVFELEGDGRVTVRPSGTEPKLKCYYEIREEITPDETFDEAEERGRRLLTELIDSHQRELGALLSG